MAELIDPADARDPIARQFIPDAAELDGHPNNARLASLATYYECVPGFQRLLAEQGNDLPRFFTAVRALARLPRDERRAQLCPAPAT